MFNSVLCTLPGGEVLVYCSKVETLKDFALYFSGTAAVFVKVTHLKYLF